MSPRNQIAELIEQGAIPVEKIHDALVVADVAPNNTAWRAFIDSLLLWLGGLALASSLVFFIAYNWSYIGRFAKFGLVEALMVLAIAAYWKFGEHTIASKVLLIVASVLLGVLLALYGQTYHTGADAWQLYFTWALLMLPWAMIGRFAAIWIGWIALVDLSIVLYHQTFPNAVWLLFDSGAGVFWSLFFFNTFCLLCWESCTGVWRWLAETWAIRLLAVGSGAPMTVLVLNAIFESEATGVLPWLVWLVSMGALYYFYRTKRPELFMLAGGCLSVIVVIVAFFLNLMLEEWQLDGFLFLALLVLGLGSGAAVWLRKIHREMQS